MWLLRRANKFARKSHIRNCCAFLAIEILNYRLCVAFLTCRIFPSGIEDKSIVRQKADNSVEIYQGEGVFFVRKS
jgi:arginyl-tRNA--protein-N-Asp/Glu arginylyltransferase